MSQACTIVYHTAAYILFMIVYILRSIPYMICVDRWPTSSRMCYGCNVRSLGEIGAIQAETQALLVANRVDHEEFTTEMLEPLHAFLSPTTGANDVTDSLVTDQDGDSNNDVTTEESLAVVESVLEETVAETVVEAAPVWTIPREEIDRRRDLRKERIFTIDPSSARDLDDALSITPLDNDTFSIGLVYSILSYMHITSYYITSLYLCVYILLSYDIHDDIVCI